MMMQRLNRFLLDQAIHDQKITFGTDEPDFSSVSPSISILNWVSNSADRSAKGVEEPAVHHMWKGNKASGRYLCH